MILLLDESFQTLIVNVDQIRMNNMNNSRTGDDNINDDMCNIKSESLEENDVRDRIKKNSMQQTEVVNMMAKISLLTIISEIFMNGYLIMVIFLDLHLNAYIDCVPYRVTQHIILIIGLCLNCFTLYATFVFNDNHYVKCCGFCHNTLKNCCVMCVTRQSFRHRVL